MARAGINRRALRRELAGQLGPLLKKKWEKNGEEKCKLEAPDGYEYIINSDNLEAVKTKSNKKSKK